MALIYIKRRKEAIEVSNERAQALKDVWIGANGKDKMDEHELVDLGEWSGEIGQIVSIEMTKIEAPKPRVQDEIEEENRAWLAMSPEAKGSNLGRFNLGWFTRSGMREKNAPEEVQAKARGILIGFYSTNPNAIAYPSDILEPLFEEHFGAKTGKTIAQTLAETKTVQEGEINPDDIPF